MPTWLKIVLALLVVGVLCVAGLVGAGVYLWKQHGPQFVAGVEQGEREGRTFGGKTDNDGCVDEGVRRYGATTALTDYIKDGIFVRSCLEASTETPGFCDGVPGALEFSKTIQWRKDECERHHLTEAHQCGQLFQQVQQYCQTRDLRRTRDAGDNSNQ